MNALAFAGGLPFELYGYLTFIAACVAVVIVPGPTVTVIIANSLRHGPRAELLNVAGTQIGLAVMIVRIASEVGRLLSCFRILWLMRISFRGRSAAVSGCL